MGFFRRIFMRELEITTNKRKLKVLVFLANLLLSSDKKIYIKNVFFLDLVDLNRKKILPEVLIKIFLPKYALTTADYIEVYSPEIQLLTLKNFTISGTCASFVSAGDLYIERYCNKKNDNAKYNSGSVLSHNNKYALVRQSDFNYIDNGFLLSGNGSWNYFHWVIEILPKLQVYLELGLYKQGIKLLVPDTVKENKNLRFLLDSILGTTKADIIFVSEYFNLNVKCLYHVTPINNILFNERNIKVSVNPFHIRYDSLSFIKSNVENSISLLDNKMFSADRIFLARKKGGGRGYNQSEIISLLIKYNFKIVYMEDHDITQQIYLFKKAKFIVGASGAAWTNLIFSNSSCKALTWLPESIQNFPVFSTLANFSGVDLSFFYTASNNYKTIQDNYIIELETFERHIKKLLQ